jgi:hypothetical protein
MYDGHNNWPFNDYGLVAHRTWGFTPMGNMGFLIGQRNDYCPFLLQL